MENSGPIVADNSAEGVVDNSVEAKDKRLQDGLAAAQEKDKAEKEPKVEEKLEENKQDDRFASKFAALTRKEKALKAKEAELNAKIKELESKQVKAPEEAKEPTIPLEKKLRRDPLGVLKEHGIDLNTLVEIALNEGKLPETMQEKLHQEETFGSLKSEIEALRAEREAEKKMQEEQRLKQEQEQNEKEIKRFKESIKEFVNANKDEYELIASEGMEELVYDVIASHFEETKDPETGIGEFLELKVAAQQVEEHLLSEAKRYLEKAKIKKLASESLVKKEPETLEKKPASVTLSNTQSQTVSGNEKRLMSNEESIANAAKLLKFLS